MPQKLAFIGFGGVGQGLAQILLERKEWLAEQFNFHAQVVAISDVQKGTLYDPQGLNLQHVLQAVRNKGTFEDLSFSSAIRKDWDSLQTIRECNADTIIEVTYTDVKTGQPAIDHCRTAFEHKKNVVTTNKGPVALAYPLLNDIAQHNGVKWGFEGTVMSGTPAIGMPVATLAGNEITEMRGILNGTTNYILTQMENGMDYEDALALAQQEGFAEADPSSDVKGYDALYKIVILTNLIMGVPLKREDVLCQGIDQLTLEDIRQAKAEGYRWKLLSSAKKEGRQVTAKVGPERLPHTDPLSSVTGATNAITYECDLVGPITLIGAGAGHMETGFSLLIDLINMERRYL